MVARTDAQKDHATFIRAAQLIVRVLPSVRFVLVGAGSPPTQRSARCWFTVSLQHRFILEERRDDVADLMGALDVFCLASRSEGFPNVIGEAMACGTPAVASDAGDARAIIGDDRLVAKVGDADALATCLLRVLQLSASQRAALGLAQRRRIEQCFDIDQIWRRYLELYLSTGPIPRRP